jgi:hypothetical protein
MAYDAEKGVACNIRKAPLSIMDELKLEAAGYRDIKTYFVKLTGSAEEAAPPAQPPG